MKVKKRVDSRHFPLFQSHIDLAHAFWVKVLAMGGWAIDATCGNGHDTLFLAQSVSAEDGVIGMDIQRKAIENTEALLKEHGEASGRVHLFCQCHAQFPPLAYQNSIRLIVYNLGYLPGGDKSLTTLRESTEASLLSALDLLASGGLLSITCYPGHLEGLIEQKALLQLIEGLPPKTWNCTHVEWKNRHFSPSLLLIQKNSL